MEKNINKIVDKIAKLLRLSESPNEHEAQLALERAQELSAKYGVELLEITEDKKHVVEQTMDASTKGVSQAARMLAHTLAPYFRVKYYYQSSYNTESEKIEDWHKSKRIIIVAYKEDAESFSLIFQFILNAFETLWNIYWRRAARQYFIDKGRKPKRSYGIGLRNDYLRGFCSGTKSRFDSNITEKGLMLYMPEAVVKYYDQLYLRYTRSSMSSAGSNSAYEHGHKDGRTLTKDKSIE